MKLTPHQLAERRLELSAQYARYSEELEIILAEKPRKWALLRKGVNSDKAADRAWEATDEGLDEMRLRLRMKAIEKKMSAAKTMLEVLEGESRNQI